MTLGALGCARAKSAVTRRSVRISRAVAYRRQRGLRTARCSGSQVKKCGLRAEASLRRRARRHSACRALATRARRSSPPPAGAQTPCAAVVAQTSRAAIAGRMPCAPTPRTARGHRAPPDPRETPCAEDLVPRRAVERGLVTRRSGRSRVGSRARRRAGERAPEARHGQARIPRALQGTGRPGRCGPAVARRLPVRRSRAGCRGGSEQFRAVAAPAAIGADAGRTLSPEAAIAAQAPAAPATPAPATSHSAGRAPCHVVRCRGHIAYRPTRARVTRA